MAGSARDSSACTRASTPVALHFSAGLLKAADGSKHKISIGLLKSKLPKLPRWVPMSRKPSKKDEMVSWLASKVWSLKGSGVRKRSKKDKMVSWLASTVWSLKGSGVRGMNARTSKRSRLKRISFRPLCGNCTVDPKIHGWAELAKGNQLPADLLDDASTSAGSSSGSPCSMPATSPHASPRLSTCFVPSFQL